MDAYITSITGLITTLSLAGLIGLGAVVGAVAYLTHRLSKAGR